jgi:dihydrofolate synthase/folylpolyglutamate synthase
MTDYAAVQDYLRGLKARGVKPGLARMERFMAALGHPEKTTPCVHVAGTNGKGSVAAMLEAILRGAGWRTGLYTSPHLVRLGERIQVNRQAMTAEPIARYTREIRPVAEALAATHGPEAHPSYFEFMTAMAFLHFARERCDFALIETGMGGRLDATNVVLPEVSVITSISFDHCEFLGDSLEQIAAEKAGIIKPSRPVVIGRLPPEAERVARAAAAQRAAAVVSLREEYGSGGNPFPATNLAGDHQRWNAAVATLAARALPARWRVTDPVVNTALQQVDWPGRWQRVQAGTRQIILEAAHNAEGAQALERALVRLIADTGRAPVVVVGVLGLTRAEPLLAAVCRHAREIHLVMPRQRRACTQDQLAALIPSSCPARVHRSTVDTVFPEAARCTAGDPGDTIVVTGSIYLLGEVLVRLDPSRGPLEDQLQDF